MEPEILYEDDGVAVFNKPAGLIVHSDGRTKEATLSMWLKERYPGIESVGEPIILQNGEALEKGGIVHRLDRETSGAIIVAKNQESFLHLKGQFQHRQIQKTYHAFVYGELKSDKGVIDRPIGKSKSDFRKWSATRGARGEMRDAITEYSVLARHEGFSYVEARPKTGRTHQIRVHFLALNYPIVCDRLYAPKKEPALGFSRLALHARKVTFKNLKGEDITVEAPFPEDFNEARRIFGL